MTTPTKKKRNRLWLLVEIILVGIIIWQGVQIGRYYWDTKTSRSAYEKIEQAVKQVQTPEPEKTEVAAAPVAEDPKERADRILTMLKELNEDTVGYIDIDALGIHYPIVQGIDNDEYLYQSFEGEYSIAGTIYMDSANHADFTDQNTVLYGHHMKDGSMFHNLSDLRKEEYSGKPVTITITREGAIDTYLVYAVSSVPEDEPYRDAYFPDESAWMEFLRDSLEGSETNFAVDPTGSTHVLTLSTCTPNDDGYRIAVHAIRQNP